MPGKFMKGALIEFMPTFLVPLPNVIIFQFNPETMTHTWTQAESAAQSGTSGLRTNPLAVRGLPGEAFSFTLQLDANDQVAEGNPIALASGVYSRIAALEMLLYPVKSAGGDLLGSVSVSVGAGGISLGGSAGGSAVKRTIPESVVPTVLFVWGPGRIVPVRVTGLTITERLYDSLLSPIHAEAQIQLRVMTPEELASPGLSGPLSELARGSYKYTQTLREVLAIANLANAAESITGLLPI